MKWTGDGNPKASGWSRRQFLSSAAGAGLVLGWGGWRELWAGAPAPDAVPGGTWLGNLPLGPEPDVPFSQPIADGLDRRLYFDLESLAPGRLVTPADAFYVRTARPDRLDRSAATWKLRLAGRVKTPRELSLADLEPWVEDRGVHLMECAGNSRFTRFGLMSAGRWGGVPMSRLLAESRPLPGQRWVRVTGFDDHSRASTNSQAGCSWIFSADALEAAGAFMATHLDGQPLTADHGAPVRLVVPGWYGCSCIKWVESLEWVDPDLPPTSQMVEFADRTHHPDGVPERARDYRPATVELAAMPVRVERWRLGEASVLRVVGIVWGGTRKTIRLGVRFSGEEPYRPVTQQPGPRDPRTWALWSHLWRPSRPGRYFVQLGFEEPGLVGRRMAAGHYLRGVALEDV